MADYIIKQISVNGTPHDLNAKYIQDETGAAKTWEDIKEITKDAFEKEVVTDRPGSEQLPANEENYDKYKNAIVLYLDPEDETGDYAEYLICRSGIEGDYTYRWEKIGTTATELTNYAQKTIAGKAGTYMTGSSGSGSTGAAGADVITTSNAGGGSASGTVSFNYDKANTNTGAAGGFTYTPSFTGTTATITLSGNVIGTEVGDHSYTPEGSISGSQTVSAHTHTIGSTTATIKAFKSGGSASLSTKNYGFSSSVSAVMYSPTVSSGVLSWSTVNAATQDALSFTAATGEDKTVVTAVDAATGSAGGVTISGSNFTFSGTTATLSHSVTPGSFSSSTSYQPAGSINGLTINDHIHSVGTSAATATATVDVVVSAHTHTVTVANHTHSIGNHTHSVVVPNAAS